MAKCLLSVIFIFAGLVFAQELSIEEELRLLGGDMFFIVDTEPREEQENVVDTTTALSDLSDEQTDEQGEVVGSRPGEGGTPPVFETRGGPRGPGFSPAMQMGRGGPGGPVGDTDTSAVVAPTSIFDAAVVASDRSIDFARNLAEYRQPQRALLYSLLLPGLGQIYNRDFARAGGYIAAEIGFISGAVYFRKTARTMQDDAYKFARNPNHFDTNKIANFYTLLAEFIETTEPITIGTPPDTLRLTIGDRIFGQSQLSSQNTVLGVVQGYMELLREDFYGNGFGIGGNFGVQGWTDATAYGGFLLSGDTPPNIVSLQGGLVIRWTGGSNFGVSALQKNFLKQMDDSRKQHNRSQVFIVGIFVNHLASATDAFISAIVHNRRLLREEAGESPTRASDIISRISVESDMYLDNVSGDLTSRLGFVWRF